MTDLPIDWEALAIADEVIASAEYQILLLRRTSYRSEDIRVIKRDSWFFVQSKSPERGYWINERKWATKEDAIMDAVECYPNPDSQLAVTYKQDANNPFDNG